MCSRGWPGNSGEPPVSHTEMPEDQGYRLTKSPGIRKAAATAAVDEPAKRRRRGHGTEVPRVMGTDPGARSEPDGMGRGSLSGA
jgi:hypothetical protein